MSAAFLCKEQYMNQVFKEELFLYFVRPNWGGAFVDNSKAIEIACSSISIDYSASYDTKSYFGNDRVETKKSAINSGSISLSVPLTYENFDFLFDAQNQIPDMSTVVPRIYQAGMLYSAIEFQDLSISFNEDDVLVMDISFNFYELSHSIIHVTSDPSFIQLVDTIGFFLITSSGEFLTEDNLIFAKDRFTLEPSILLLDGGFPVLDENGNPVVDENHAFFDTASSDSLTVQQFDSLDLTRSDRLLHASACSFNLEESNSESAEYSIFDLTISNLSYSVSRTNRIIRDLNSRTPRKLIKTSLETSTDLSFPLMEEQTQALFVGAQSYETKYVTLPKFKLTILLKDVELNAPTSNIYIDGFFESMRSSTSSLGVPRGSLTIIEKIK